MKRCLAGMAALLLVLAAGCRRTPSPDGSESEGLPSASSDVTLPWEPSPDSETVPTSSPTPTQPEPTRSSPPSSAPTASSPPTTAVPTEPPRAETVRLTFKEGDSLTKIFQKLEDGGVTTVAKLMEASDTLDLSEFPLAAAMPQDSRRCFRLEGYLFPDTYEFYVGMQASSAINKMLDNFNRKITEDMQARLDELGMSLGEIVNAASLIEKEAANDSERPVIASVIYNRLNYDMPLGIDAAVLYPYPEHEGAPTAEMLAKDDPYNTRIKLGLPPTPISNPGIASINAALWPDATDYFYYALDTATGTHQFFTNETDFNNFVATQNYE